MNQTSEKYNFYFLLVLFIIATVAWGIAIVEFVHLV